MKDRFVIPLFLVISLFTLFSCKPQIEDNGVLEFSIPELTFDTVFTTVGSITKSFTVHNPTNSEIMTSIYLAGAPYSYFSINVDGLSGTSFSDVIIPPKDSIFVHVTVNINPGNQNTPFLVKDSIVFQTKNADQDFDLLAYGQDANFIVANSGSGSLRFKVVAGPHETVHWTNEKPYVVYGWAAVDSLGTLIIDPGTRVYFHDGSGIWVYSYGNIQVNGTTEEPVLFRGDRLESWFDSDYAQWSRIWINEGYGENRISNAIITNAFVGLQVEPLTTYTANKTIVENTIIKNCDNSGVIARFANLEMNNCLITNCGGACLQMEIGTYLMKHLTLANYFIQDERKLPALYVSDTSVLYGSGYQTDARFFNTIIYGTLDDEVAEDIHPSLYSSQLLFQNCLIKNRISLSSFSNCLLNQNPLFKNTESLDFQLEVESPAIDRGISGIGINEDLLGNSRDNSPDIGAYEFVR